MDINNEKLVLHQSKKMRLMQHILEQNLRVFRRQELEQHMADDLTLSYQALSNLMYQLCKAKWLQQLRRGLYQVANPSTPIHEYEIAMALAKPAMVSHRSAFSFHELTDQVIRNTVTVTTTNSVFVPQEGLKDQKTAILINGIEYRFVCINQDKFFGEEVEWVGEGKFKVTNLERTLLDGLSQPQYCGGIQEVIYAYRESIERVNLDQIINYAMRLNTATARRLGWVLDQIFNIDMAKISCLAQKDKPGYRLLDPSRAPGGSYDPKWRIQQNHHGNI